MPWLFLYHMGRWSLFKKIYSLLLVLLLLSGCVSIPSQTERNEHARKLTSDRGWIASTIKTDDFSLQTYAPAKLQSTKELTIYIEGDGIAWINQSTLSFNPTPANPLALKLALQDNKPAAYLARPCQYVSFDQSPNCSQKYWSSHRFSPEVIHSSNQAIEQLKLKFKAEKIILVGYSGGGAVAALVAAKRSDVIRLVTVAGNLDHEAWSKLHRISSLEGSLNPADEWQSLQKISQLHLVGASDLNISPEIANAFAAKFPRESQPRIKVIENFDHICCWVQQWPALLDQ